MKKLLTQLRNTFLAGLIFLMPVAIILFLFGKLYVLAKEKSVKLAAILGVNDFLGVSAAGLVGLAIILLSCLLFGLLMRIKYVKRLNRFFDKKLGDFVPVYGVYSKMALEKLDVTHKMQLYECMLWAHFGDSWQPGFLVKRLSEKQYMVFVPDAGPGNRHTGAIHVMDASNVMLCPDVSMKDVSNAIEQLGTYWPKVPLPPQNP